MKYGFPKLEMPSDIAENYQENIHDQENVLKRPLVMDYFCEHLTIFERLLKTSLLEFCRSNRKFYFLDSQFAL